MSALRRTKARHWRDLLTSDSEGNIWGPGFRLIRGKLKKSYVAVCDVRKDGEGDPVESALDQLRLSVERYLPRDDPAGDDGHQAEVRERAEELVNSCALPKEGLEKEFSPGEVKAALFGMDPNRAPGGDGITGKLVRVVGD